MIQWRTPGRKLLHLGSFNTEEENIGKGNKMLF